MRAKAGRAVRLLCGASPRAGAACSVHLSDWSDSHRLRSGQPASIHALNVSAGQRFDRPKFTAAGIFPALSRRHHVRRLKPHAAAASPAVNISRGRASLRLNVRGAMMVGSSAPAKRSPRRAASRRDSVGTGHLPATVSRQPLSAEGVFDRRQVVAWDQSATADDRAEIITKLPVVKQVADGPRRNLRPERSAQPTGSLGHTEVIRHPLFLSGVGGRHRDSHYLPESGQADNERISVERRERGCEKIFELSGSIR